MQLDCHRSLYRRIAGGFLVFLLLANAPVRAASDEQVSAAIEKAVKFLRGSAKGGNWEIAPSDPSKLSPQGGPSDQAQFGGRTALAAYALLAAGEKATDKEDPELAKAVEWLKTADIRGTYGVGLRAQVWLLAGKALKGRESLIENDVNFLLNSCITKGDNAGFYGYSYTPKPTKMKFGEGGPAADYWYDRSNSQYGVLGMWALQQAGAEIPSKYWEVVDKAWRDKQHHDGGWDYRDDADGGSTPTMTAAGVASLFITQDYLLLGRHWEPCGGGVNNNFIENALLKMEKPIRGLLTTGNFYGMYGVERIGTASGRKYFDKLNWYETGSDFLMGSQAADGSWAGAYGPVIDTSFALIFLARGRAPVMMNKLQYTIDSKKEKQLSPWDERPRDVANLARWLGQREEGYLNWQVVNLVAPVAELHDAPILYIAGSEELNLSVPDREKLRAFAESGGIILGQADCNSQKFAKSFEELGEKLFPKYKFRELPGNHPIFAEGFSAKRWRSPVRIRGLSNGARELMMLTATSDLGRSWQTDSSKTHQEAFEAAADIFFYAVDKTNLYNKGATYYVEANPTPVTIKVPVARINYDEKANWNPEPGGWRRLAALFHNNLKVDLDVQEVTLGGGKLAPFKVAHLTGTGKLSLSADQQSELVDFVKKGGTLLVDATGGDAEFAATAQTLLGQMFPAGAAALQKDLPMDSPVFTTAYPGHPIESVTFRQFAIQQRVGNSKVARLKGIPADGGRIGVFFSAEDLSTGLVGQPVDGVVGYLPNVATKLMTNLVLFATHTVPPPPPAPPKPAPPAPAPPTPAPPAPAPPAPK